jgi:hypothetical protein
MDYAKYIQLPNERKSYEAYCTIDPGFSTKASRDYTGIVVVLYNEQNHGFIELAKRFRLTVPELLDKMYELDAIYHFEFLGVESGTWQSALKQTFEYIIATENRKYLPIEPIKTPNFQDAKHKRIVQAAGFINRHILSFKVDPEGETDPTGDCIKEMYYYSSSSRQHDDVIDALAMQQLVHTWGDAPVPFVRLEHAKSVEEEIEEWRKKHDTYKIALENKRNKNRKKSWPDF